MKKKIFVVVSVLLLFVAAIFLIHRVMQRDIRNKLFSELKPVTLNNCVMKRFGHPNDGGYVMCENLLDRVQSAYSCGIDGRDEWGCDISRKYNAPVHQYDCFNTTQPVCPEGRFIFHAECIGDTFITEGNRRFDNLANQILKNNDQNKSLVVKMDVEGAEWNSLLATPDPILSKIDQLVVEFHVNLKKPDGGKYLQVMQKLKTTFYLVNVHFNNSSCTEKYQPFPGWAFEILFVNKRIGNISVAESKSVLPNPQDAPNIPGQKDCQASVVSHK